MSLENTPAARISALAAAQKTYFRSGATLSEAFRRTMLRRLDAALANWEKRLCDALWTDLHKSPEEAYLTEISIVRGEIRSHLRHLGRWVRPAPRPTPLKLLPAKSRIVSQPLGQALIVAPWNYPVQLLLNPLVGAISAGCTALLKPSPYTPNVAEALEGMIAEIFDEEYVAVAQGGREVNTLLFGMRWDVIFFTGSPALGRIVMTAAARNLTPVVLELGGKSPSIVDRGGRHRGRGAPHRLGQDPQRRADLHRTRLPADPPIAARRVLPSLRPRPASASRRRRAAKPPLRSAGQRPGFRARNELSRAGENPCRGPHRPLRPLYRADAARGGRPRRARDAGGDLRADPAHADL